MVIFMRHADEPTRTRESLRMTILRKRHAPSDALIARVNIGRMGNDKKNQIIAESRLDKRAGMG